VIYPGERTVALGVEHEARWHLRCWPEEGGGLRYAVMACDTRMGYTPQVIQPGALEPTVAFFELKPSLDAALVAGSVPAGVWDALLRDNKGGSRRLTLIPFSFTAFCVAPVDRDVEWVRVLARDRSGVVSEACKRSLRLKARARRGLG
jgi:hypothetical protein